MENSRILLTGAGGQVGQVLGKTLEERYKKENILATDLKPVDVFHQFELLDVLDVSEFRRIVERFRPDVIFHLVGVLSAVGESDPQKSWNVNTRGWINTLEMAVEFQVSKVFFPSSIAVFGPGSSLEKAGQNDALHPLTMYGVTKVAGENLGQYYFSKFGLDVRALRYPGIISYQCAPGGGTTDYSVEIFQKAMSDQDYECYIEEDIMLPMMFIDDAIRGTLELMETPAENLTVRSAYNFSGVSFTPAMLADEIRKYIPKFEMKYKPDFRNEIAKGWPDFIVDQEAKTDWGWEHEFELEHIVQEMFYQLRAE